MASECRNGACFFQQEVIRCASRRWFGGLMVAAGYNLAQRGPSFQGLAVERNGVATHLELHAGALQGVQRSGEAPGWGGFTPVTDGTGYRQW